MPTGVRTFHSPPLNISKILNSIEMPWKTEKEEKIIQSLTCFSLEVSPPQETLMPGPCYRDDRENSSLGKKVFGKFYLNLPNNKRKLYALMDTASDITLIHLDLLQKLLIEFLLH